MVYDHVRDDGDGAPRGSSRRHGRRGSRTVGVRGDQGGGAVDPVKPRCTGDETTG